MQKPAAICRKKDERRSPDEKKKKFFDKSVPNEKSLV